MDQKTTGAFIRTMRRKNHMTQSRLAEILQVSDKTVSKWESGKGYPDITMLESIAEAFQVSVNELLAGDPSFNTNLSSNMIRSCLYVCPMCGNVLFSMGDAEIVCHGIRLKPLKPEKADEDHLLHVERVGSEYYVRVDHPMDKNHFISWIAAVGNDRIQLVKLYPEGNAEAYFSVAGVRKFVYYCTKHEAFQRISIGKGKV